MILPAIVLVPLTARSQSFGLARRRFPAALASGARLNAGTAHLLAIRCRPDRICPRAKIDRLQREFPVGLENREYAEAGERNCLGERPHATFTREYRIAPNASADHHSRRAFADLVAFFDRHLRTGVPISAAR
jgi:hypothetical protein